MSDVTKIGLHEWLWTLMIMQPDFITEELAEAARKQAIKKKGLMADRLLLAY